MEGNDGLMCVSRTHGLSVEGGMMWSELLMLMLQGWCALEAMYRGTWCKAMYWIGAFILTVAVVKGIKT